MGTSISHSPTETFELGKAWGQEVQAGWVIALCGDLGAGKTQLVKGLAEGLAIKKPILSPTFSLVNVYTEGRVPLFHLDLYRLDTREQIAGAGLEEYFQPNGVAVIEWAERWFEAKPPKTFVPGDGDDRWKKPCRPVLRWVEIQIVTLSERQISYEDFGA
jgi:tRNA threonylcarbamoyladenosine biosynthesis protein TsaE